MLGFPLIAWGAADDPTLAPWGNVGTPLLANGQADPFGGTGAALLTDDDAAIGEARFKTFVADRSTVTIPLMVRQGSSDVATWRVFDFTSGGANTAFVHLTTWGTGVPTITVGAMAGSMVVAVSPVIALGGGWYMVLATFTGLVIGNLHRFYLYPASNSAAPMGGTYFYVRNLILLDLIDEDKAWDEPPPGSQQARAASGIYDRWIPGGRRDYRFRGKARWIPSEARFFPAIVSGWNGSNPTIGIDAGVRTMLRAGQEGNDLLWVPDRSACSDSVTSEMVKPWSDDVYDHDNTQGDRAFTLELRNTVKVYPTVL